MEYVILYIISANSEKMKKAFSKAFSCLLLLLHRAHNRFDLRFAGLSAHLHEHCPDHLLRDRRILLQLLLEILSREIEADQRADGTA